MNSEYCSRIDDFLDGDLAELERLDFEAHLATCDACRRAVELDRRWGSLLAAASPVAPASLTRSIAGAVERSRRLRIARAAALVGLAAGLAFAAARWNFDPPKVPVARSTDTSVSRPSASADERPEVRIIVAPESRVLAMPLESKNPQVSIVWLYPEFSGADQTQEIESN